MNQYFTPQEIAQSRFMQTLFDLWNDVAPLATTVMLLLAFGLLLVTVIVAGFVRNQERDASRRSPQVDPEALTTDKLCEARGYADIGGGNVTPITRARCRADDSESGGGVA